MRARIRVGQEPHHFAAGAGALWVSDNGGALLLRVDLRSGRVRKRARVGAAPHHVAIAGGDVLVAVHGTDGVALVSRQGRLQRTIHAGDGPHGIAAVWSASR